MTAVVKLLELRVDCGVFVSGWHKTLGASAVGLEDDWDVKEIKGSVQEPRFQVLEDIGKRLTRLWKGTEELG